MSTKLSLSERLRQEKDNRKMVIVPRKITTVPRKKKVVAHTPNKLEILERVIAMGEKSSLPDYRLIATTLQGSDRNSKFQVKRIKDFLDLLLTTYTVVEKHD